MPAKKTHDMRPAFTVQAMIVTDALSNRLFKREEWVVDKQTNEPIDPPQVRWTDNQVVLSEEQAQELEKMYQAMG